MMNSSSVANAGPMQPSLRPQAVSTSMVGQPVVSSLPPTGARPPGPSQTPDRSPATQLPTSYPSPNQQSSSAKSTSNSLAQLEQMVMPNSGQAAGAVKSPTHRSSTNSPGANAQQSMQYSYNSSGQGSYFSSGSTAVQSSYYPSYEPTSGIESAKPSAWSDQSSNSLMNPPPSGSTMIENSYNQSAYDGSSGYGDYTQLSTPSQSRFPAPNDMPPEPHQADKSDPYAIDSQTFDDHDEQTSTSKAKKGRAKKSDDSTKRERKQRAPRAPKGATGAAAAAAASAAAAAAAATTPATPTLQPQSPIPNSSIQSTQNKPPQPSTSDAMPVQTDVSDQPTPPPAQVQAPVTIEPIEAIPQHSSSYSSPNQQPSASQPASNSLMQLDQMVMTSGTPAAGSITNKSPTLRSTTSSPSTNSQAPMQYPQYNSTTQDGYYNSSSSTNQACYYPPYDTSTGTESQKAPGWTDQTVAAPSGNTNAMKAPVAASSYDQPSYSSNYNDYAQLSTPSQPPNFVPPGTAQAELDDTQKEESESQNVEESDDKTPAPKTKKSRSKKGDETSKKKRQRSSKAAKAAIPQSPSAAASSQGLGDLSAQMLESTSMTTELGDQSIMQSEDTVTVTGEPQQSEDKPEQEAKPKKSRVRKSEDKPKRDRKSRAAAKPTQSAPAGDLSTPPPAAVQPTISVTTEESVEAPVSQPSTEATPAETKPKRIRVRDSSSKGKKKLPKFALKFAKTKKRKRLGSSDNEQSDLDKTPPPSPDEIESGVQKRRSARNTKKLKYNDDIELGFSESDDDSQIASKKKSTSASTTVDGESMADDSVVAEEPTVFAAPVEDTMVVEKIMASRMGKRELEPEPGEVLPPDGTHIDVEEFYVKYKNMSYLHCDWRTLEELEKGDRRVAQKIKRYKQKKDSSNVFSFMDEDLFDPQYCEVDRILAVNEVEEMVPDSEDEGEKLANGNSSEATIDKVDFKAEEIKSEIDNSENKLAEVKKSSKLAPSDAPKVSDDNDQIPSKADESALDGDVKSTNAEVASFDEPSRLPDTSIEDEVKASMKSNGDSVEVDQIQPSEDSQTRTDLETKKDNNAVEEKPRKMKKKVSRHYLVKWRALSYEDSTWELEEHLDPDKIKAFERFKDPPPKSKWKRVNRPKPEEWVRKEVSPVYKNNNTLREYQLEGINWLSFCWHQGRNCILADEMGLGKTIQSIAFVNEIYEKGIYGPFLIIVPLSTVGNWAREFETWTNLNVITYHGSSTSREMLKEYEMFYRNEQGNRITSYYKFQVMITTFEIILSDCLDLREIPWRCCIIDEAHRLKNRNCKLLEGLRLLNMEHRVLLTGTPLQNNVEELFSLLNFLEPTQFSSTEQFLQEFGDLKTEAQVDKLKLILKPMMLRRLKEDVEKTLAPKEETIVEVELTNIQKKYYRAILERNFSFLSKGTTNNNMPNLMNTMMELRKCCIHPYLINGAEEQILYEAREAKLAGGESMSSQQAMVNASGKLVLIDKLLPRLKADGHRVLIFSQMVRCLDILEDYVTHKHYPYERIDGRVRGSDRQQAIDRFSKPGSDRFVFLLCTRAGGLGINLTAADTVIIFDSDWNPQNDLQAQARCHRIGQSKAVKIYRLICRNTYEREMFDKASLKLGLDKAVLQSMNTQKTSGGLDGQLTKKEIEELLRKGAYGALMDDDNAGDKFCEEDIDQILQRRTQVITIESSEAKGSTFSKATFSSSNNREDIELDDPNFWEKWAKKANIENDDMLGKDELIQLAPRRRTQTKRYGADGTLIEMSDLDSSEEDEETISMRTRGSRRGHLKPTPSSASKRGKRRSDYEDDDFMANIDGGYWSKSDCLKIEDGLLTYGWGRWDEIIANNRFKRDINAEDCESICRVILLYCLNSYKGDEKIKSFAWELISPPEEASKSDTDADTSVSTRGRKPKSLPLIMKKTIAEEISDANWPKEAKNDPLIALPDDQYRRHLQRNCNR